MMAVYCEKELVGALLGVQYYDRIASGGDNKVQLNAAHGFINAEVRHFSARMNFTSNVIGTPTYRKMLDVFRAAEKVPKYANFQKIENTYSEKRALDASYNVLTVKPEDLIKLFYDENFVEPYEALDIPCDKAAAE